jgi:hypothetical protein
MIERITSDYITESLKKKKKNHKSVKSKSLIKIVDPYHCYLSRLFFLYIYNRQVLEEHHHHMSICLPEC